MVHQLFSIYFRFIVWLTDEKELKLRDGVCVCGISLAKTTTNSFLVGSGGVDLSWLVCQKGFHVVVVSLFNLLPAAVCVCVVALMNLRIYGAVASHQPPPAPLGELVVDRLFLARHQCSRFLWRCVSVHLILYSNQFFFSLLSTGHFGKTKKNFVFFLFWNFHSFRFLEMTRKKKITSPFSFFFPFEREREGKPF